MDAERREGREVALETAKANGFDDAAADIEVTVTPVGNRRLRVYIHDTGVERYFSSLFVSTVDIERQALAEYVQACRWAVRTTRLGNDPERWTGVGLQPAVLLAERGLTATPPR